MKCVSVKSVTSLLLCLGEAMCNILLILKLKSDITSEFQEGMLQDRYDLANMGAPCFSRDVLDICLVPISESLRFTKVNVCQAWNGYSLLDRQAMPSTNVKT